MLYHTYVRWYHPRRIESPVEKKKRKRYSMSEYGTELLRRQLAGEWNRRVALALPWRVGGGRCPKS